MQHQYKNWLTDWKARMVVDRQPDSVFAQKNGAKGRQAFRAVVSKPADVDIRCTSYSIPLTISAKAPTLTAP